VYVEKRGVFEKHGCGIKESAVREDVSQAEYAGKSYCGKKECPRIGNTMKNKSKTVALVLCLWKGGLEKDVLDSVIGSIAFLGCQRGWCFPFLNKCMSFVLGSGLFEEEDLIKDVVVALVIACIPWTPSCEVRWLRGSVSFEKFVFVDAQNDFGRFGMVWCKDGVWMERSVRIPKKYCDSQQSAELFGVKKAVGFGLNEVGNEFVIVSDSVGSIHAMCRMKMCLKSWRRNQLLRMMVGDLIGKKLRIGCLWVPSESNPSDGGSRMVLEEDCMERVYEGDMSGVFVEGVCLNMAEYYNRVGSGKP
jgi:hypothetical protein